MRKNTNLSFCTVPQLESFSFLRHGFGSRALNRSDLAKEAGWPEGPVIALKQIHSDTLHVLESSPSAELSGDALVTGRPGLLLTIRTADCLPVLILSPQPRVIAAVHCGWRGTSLGIVQKVIRAMGKTFGVPPETLIAALGPSIEQACYEVGEDVRETFKGQQAAPHCFFPQKNKKKHFLFDLRGLNRKQLLETGVRPGNILSVDRCTRCDPRYYSYRRDPGEAGRMINFIGMTG